MMQGLIEREVGGAGRSAAGIVRELMKQSRRGRRRGSEAAGAGGSSPTPAVAMPVGKAIDLTRDDEYVDDDDDEEEAEEAQRSTVHALRMRQRGQKQKQQGIEFDVEEI
jgi:hypothetical protein